MHERRSKMAQTDLSNIKVTKVVDERSHACPGPLIETKKAIVSIPTGCILEVWASDPTAAEEIPIWAKDVGHECLGVVAADGYSRIFVLRKK
jgi:tRNA 2-thiouridine synthesizing protein A